MERKRVDEKKSSQVRSIGYDKEKQVLQIEFSSGGVYDYSGVPESVYDDFIRAESLGQFVATRIRGEYEYKRLHIFECLAGNALGVDCGCPCWCHRLTKTSREMEKPSEKKSTRKSKGCICDPKVREDQIGTNPYCKAKHA